MDPNIRAIASYLEDSYSHSYLIAYAQDLGIPDLDITPVERIPILIAQVLADHGYTRATLPINPRGFFPQFQPTSDIGGQSGDPQYGGSPGQYGSNGLAPAFGSTRGRLAYTDLMGFTVPELPTSRETDYSVPFLGPPMLLYEDRQPPANSMRPYYRQPPLGDALASDDGEETQEWKGNISNRFGAASSVHGLRGEVMSPHDRASSRYGIIYTTTGFPAGGGASQYGGTYGGSSSPAFNGLSPRSGPNPTSSPLKPYVPQVPPRLNNPLPRLITELPGSRDPYMDQLRQIHNQHPWEANGRMSRPSQAYPGSVSVGDEAARRRDVARNRAMTGDGRFEESWDSGIIAEPFIPYNGRASPLPRPQHPGRAPKSCGCRAKRYK